MVAFPAVKSALETKKIFGIESIDTGVFGGILVGLIAGFRSTAIYRIKLPPYLGFFAGKRFVPIVPRPSVPLRSGVYSPCSGRPSAASIHEPATG